MWSRSWSWDFNSLSASTRTPTPVFVTGLRPALSYTPPMGLLGGALMCGKAF